MVGGCLFLCCFQRGASAERASGPEGGKARGAGGRSSEPRRGRPRR